VVNQNRDWLYERGPDGVDRLSPWGQRYAAYEQQATQMGIQGTQQAHAYAYSMVERDFAMAQYMQGRSTQNAQQTGDAAKQALVNGARQHATTGLNAVSGPNGTPAAAPPMRGQQDLYARMMQNMAAGGYQPHQELIGR
jgi:hypothetical protein